MFRRMLILGKAKSRFLLALLVGMTSWMGAVVLCLDDPIPDDLMAKSRLDVLGQIKQKCRSSVGPVTRSP